MSSIGVVQIVCSEHKYNGLLYQNALIDPFAVCVADNKIIAESVKTWRGQFNTKGGLMTVVGHAVPVGLKLFNASQTRETQMLTPEQRTKLARVNALHDEVRVGGMVLEHNGKIMGVIEAGKDGRNPDDLTLNLPMGRFISATKDGGPGDESLLNTAVREAMEEISVSYHVEGIEVEGLLGTYLLYRPDLPYKPIVQQKIFYGRPIGLAPKDDDPSKDDAVVKAIPDLEGFIEAGLLPVRADDVMVMIKDYRDGVREVVRFIENKSCRV